MVKEINIAKIKQNIYALKSKNEFKKVMYVAKADCYGLGNLTAKFIEPVTDYYAVATLEEAVVLRELGIIKPILIFLSDVKEAEKYIEYDLIANFYRIEELTEADRIAKKADRILKIHLPVDSGMNRFGIKNYNAFLKLLEASTFMLNIKIESVYTHFCSTARQNIIFQYNRFAKFVDYAKKFDSGIFYHALSSTYAYMPIEKFGEYDMLRLGIGGILSLNSDTFDCVGIYGKILEIKELIPGESLGYNMEYVAAAPTRVAIVGGGYADGIKNGFSGMHTIINDSFCKIIGRVCMDVCFVDVSRSNAKIGDKVIFAGESETKCIRIKDISDYTKISEYEILVGFNGRIKMLYLNN